jgi:EspA/EspE family
MVKVIGELIESIAGRAGLKNVREFGESLTKPGKGPAGDRAGELLEKLMDVLGSDLLDYGQTIIAGMKNTTGQGDPERGNVFGQAQSTFNGVNETLKSAVPDDGWEGSGSYAYADQNTRQQLRSEAMADADHEVHKVLYREAAQITLRRGYLDDQYNFLANTSYVTFPLQFIPRYGEAMKLAIEIAALQTALGESYHQINQLQSEVAQNAAELQQAVGRYSGVADGAELPSAAVNFDPPPPPPGGGALPGTIPIERSQPRVAPGWIARPSGVSGGIDGTLVGDSGPTVTADTATQPMVAGLPPLPQVPPLGSVLTPMGGLVTGAIPATGQPAATPVRPHSKKAARPRDDERPADGETDEFADDDKDQTKAASGDAESERAPVSNPDLLQAPLAVTLDSDNPAGTPRQDRR